MCFKLRWTLKVVDIEVKKIDTDERVTQAKKASDKGGKELGSGWMNEGRKKENQHLVKVRAARDL